MRSLIILIFGIAVASAGGYYYRDSIPADLRFWESPSFVELKNETVGWFKPTLDDVAEHERTTPVTSESEKDKSASIEPIEESHIKESAEQLKKDARIYVNELSTIQTDKVPVENADHFVGANQILELLNDDAFVELLAPLNSKPVIQALAPRSRSVISKLGSDFDTEAVNELILIQASSTEDLQPLFSTNSEKQNPGEPVMIVRKANAGIPARSGVVREEQDVTAETLTDHPQQTNSLQITIADLLKDEKPAKEGSIYYVRTVKPDDKQGIWGIIVDGLTENFANGIAISRDKTIDTYQVNIPRLSDDALPDNSSSFLGKMVDRKTRECFVYNFVEKKIGQNPDLIYPGQELLIINFEAEELIDIYTHFVGNG